MSTATKTVPTQKLASYWQKACRQYSRRKNGLTPVHEKLAAIGADEDMPFEQAMSNLAHATLRDKAPGLLDYELGFQLIEKNDDEDKAIGVFGFKVGNQIFYAPVFFLNGELKGHQLLYMKSQDAFVPLSEDWINYLLARKPITIGDPISQNETSRMSRRPDLRSLRVPPTSPKLGEAIDNWFPDAVATLQANVKWAEQRPEPVLPRVLNRFGKCAATFVAMLDAYPHLVDTFIAHYGADMVKQACERARTYYQGAPEPSYKRPTITGSICLKEQEKTAGFDPTYGGKLQIHVYHGDYVPGLSDTQRQELLTKQVLVIDQREKTAEAYEEQHEIKLDTPNATGIYQILVKPGDFLRCFVAMQPRKPHGEPAAIVVKLDGDEKQWQAIHNTKLWSESQETPTEFRQWLEGLSSAESASGDSTYMFISPQGETIGPVSLGSTLPAAPGEKCYRAYFRSYSPSLGNMLTPSHRADDDTYSRQPRAEAVSIGLAAGSKMISRSGIYYIPKDWKALKLSEGYGSEDVIRPGDMVDVHVGIISKLAAVRIVTDGIEAEINKRRMPHKAAMLHLIRDYNLREKTARDLLHKAHLRSGARFLLKQAEGSPWDQFGGGFQMPQFPEFPPQADAIMGSSYPAAPNQEMDVPVPSTYPTDDRSMAEPPMPDPDAMNNVLQAAELGQREVLDTSALSAMLRTNRSETLIDENLGDAFTGLDAIGRLLFNFYWRNDIYADRYGDDELKEIEDLLITSFENTGDLVLKLRQETIEPFPGEALTIGMGDR